MDRSQLAIIIPALNEAATVAAIVHAVRDFCIPIVVDDGSFDRTAKHAFAAGAITVIHEINLGYDAALNSGFARAKELGCTYALTMDADGQHDPAVLHLFIEALDQGADVVAGVRDRYQRLAEGLFAIFAYVRWGLKDPLCGLKAYRMDLYRELGHFDSTQSIGTELLIFAARGRRRIEQLPIKTRNRLDAPRFGSRIRGNLRILRALVAMAIY